MELLLILTYTAVCVFIFKVFRIPLNKWTVPTAVLGGVVIIGALLVVMNYNHPYSDMSRRYFNTTPIISTVAGRVISVPVTSNVMLKKGDILFQIDPVPYQNRLDSLRAQLKNLEVDLARANTLVPKGALAVRDRDAIQAKVEQFKADEANAIYELGETTVRAPSKGYVTHVALRPGMVSAALPLRPLMTFVHYDTIYFVGWFRQNSLLRLKVGDEAEVIFDAVPGKIFTGVVKTVLPALAEGQISPTGELIYGEKESTSDRIPVIIDITDPSFNEYEDVLPLGVSGQAAIYTYHFHHVAVMRKILLRMASWMNYLFPFH